MALTLSLLPTKNSECLDLTESNKPTSKELAHNISVIYDRVCLPNRVHIKNFKKILENYPLTERKVQEIVLQMVAQPKVIEEKALKLSEDLKQKLDRLEEILHKVETWVGS